MNTPEKKRRSPFGIVVAAVLLLLVVCALIFLFAGRRSVQDGDTLATSGGQGTSANQQVEVKQSAGEGERGHFKAIPATVKVGERVELDWDVPGAKSVRITGIEGSFGDRGRHILPKFDEQVIAATGAEGHASDPDMHAFTMRATMQDDSERMLTASVKIEKGTGESKGK